MDHNPTMLAFLKDYSVEVTGSSSVVEAACNAGLKPGTEVYIAFVPGEEHRRLVNVAVKLRRAGLEPVPHIVARSIAHAPQLDGFLARLSAEAGVTRALVLAGDIDKPVGDYLGSVDLLRTGLFQRHGVCDVRLSFYPEPHSKIEDALLLSSMGHKLAAVKENGLKATLVSQFCFDVAPIRARLEELRGRGLDTPIRVGIAGPASRRTLLRYALYCGVGASIKALTSRPELGQLADRATPDEMLAGLAELAQVRPDLGIVGVHFFTFGGIPATLRWISKFLAARI